MRAAHLLGICILPVLALAQNSSVSDLIQSLPFCALGPLTTVTGDISCSIDDIPCLCNDKSFITSLTTKLEAACSADDVKEVVQLASEQCANNGVTVDIPVNKESNNSSWGDRTRVVDLGMMLGIVGLAGLVGL